MANTAGEGRGAAGRSNGWITGRSLTAQTIVAIGAIGVIGVIGAAAEAAVAGTRPLRAKGYKVAMVRGMLEEELRKVMVKAV